MTYSTEKHDTPHWLMGLPSPVKNNFYYGLLLTDELLRKDQRYFDGKRWLLNRLAVGKGVLSGLDFQLRDEQNPATTSGANEIKPGCVRIDPGVAVDGYGREIIVPDIEHATDVEIATDDKRGRSEVKDSASFLKALDVTKPAEVDGKFPPKIITVELQIAYRSESTDPAPVKAGNCSQDCQPSTIREKFKVRVRIPDPTPRHLEGQAVAEEYTRTDGKWPALGKWPAQGNLPTVFPPEPTEAVRHRWEAQKGGLQAEPFLPESNSDPAWVSLGFMELTVTWDGVDPRLVFVKKGRNYRQLYSNDGLSKLIFGLADRVDEAARVRLLTFEGVGGQSGEGQTANVYAPLAKQLKVKVVNCNGEAPSDFDSIMVRFEVQSVDGGILKWGEFDSNRPYSESTGMKSLQVGVNFEGQLLHPVSWRMSKTPGLHTVVARVVPKLPLKNPPSQWGSQLIFHATAKPAAPTIVGVEFDDLWWYDDECHKHNWNERKVTLKLFFSRRIEGLEHLPQVFQAWAVHHHRGQPKSVYAHRLEFKGNNKYHDHLVCTSTEKSLDEIWQVECELTGLPKDLSHKDTLRIVLLGKVTETDVLKSVGSPHYPTPQVLDLTFDGSYLSEEFRHRLWSSHSKVESPSQDEKGEAVDDSSEHQSGYEGAPPAHQKGHSPPQGQYPWDAFRPRECCLPTGDGTEGGEYHKTFEYRLPRC